MEPILSEVAQAVSIHLIPYAGWLSAAKFSAEAVGEMAVQDGLKAAWQQAKNLWQKFNKHDGADSMVNNALKLIVADPNETLYKATLVKAIQNNLKADPTLLQEIISLLGGADSVQKIVATNKSWVEDITMVGDGFKLIQADASTVKNVKMRS